MNFKKLSLLLFQNKTNKAKQTTNSQNSNTLPSARQTTNHEVQTQRSLEIVISLNQEYCLCIVVSDKNKTLLLGNEILFIRDIKSCNVDG